MVPYIIGLSGSPQKNSLTASAIKYAIKGAAAVGAKTKIIHLSEFNLSIAGTNNLADYENDFMLLSDELKKATGIIIGTPEHNNSISSILKNAIDLLDNIPFKNKLIGLIGLTGGEIGAINSLNNLILICRSLHCWVSPLMVSIANTDKIFDQNQNLNDDKIINRLFKLGYSTAAFSSNIQKCNFDLIKNNYEKPMPIPVLNF